MDKKTLIVVLSTMEIGGVQQTCLALMEYAISKDYRVVWLHKNPIRAAVAYRYVLDKVEKHIYECDYCSGLKTNVCFSDQEKVTLLTFTPADMHCALLYASTRQNIKITPLYVVSNTKGRFNYIEYYYWGFFRRYVKDRYSDIIRQWQNMNLIRFFHIDQFYAYQKSYGVSSFSPNDLVWKNIKCTQPLDHKVLENRVKRTEFNIVTVSRFDFPHKQYLLGLINDFAILKKKYPILKLHIIGYGHDEDKVNNAIANLSSNVAKDIILYGQKGEKEIAEIMKNMHLNIGVAACVGVGARNGVISLPARNFCLQDCEVYGYLPQSKTKIVSTEPGELALPYIEEVINMSDREYRQKCIDSYESYVIHDADPDYMFRQTSNSYDYNFEKGFARFFLIFMTTRDYFWKIGDIFNKLFCKKNDRN